MSVKSETIATQSTKLSKEIIKITKELRVPNKDTNINELEKEKANLKEKEAYLKAEIENTIYKMTESTNPNEMINVLLADEFIIINGLSLVNDIEFKKIADYLGYDHYTVQPYAIWLDIYFYNGTFGEVQEC